MKGRGLIGAAVTFERWRERLANLFLLLIAVTALAVFTFQYLTKWTIAYSSDTAMIGLMAKYILEHGERPVFVWSVGYQGMVLEGYGTALAFKLFGINPVSHNFAPTTYLCLALALWTRLFWRTFGARTAVLALLATVFSSPMFYQLNMRTLPNFPEALLLGALLFSVFELCLTNLRGRGQFKILLLGALSGFAIYTFALTIYYLVSIGAVVLLIFYRYELAHGLRSFILPWGMPWRIVPSGVSRKHWQHWALVGLGVLAWAGIIGGLISLFHPADFFEFRGRMVKRNALGVIVAAVCFLAAPKVCYEAWTSLRASLVLRWRAAAFVVGFVIGYSPALYFKLMGGHSIKQALASGNWASIVKRWGIYRSFHAAAFHARDDWTIVFALYFLLCVVAFLAAAAWSVKGYIQNSRSAERTDFRAGLPPIVIYGVMAVFGLLIFLISKAVVDAGSMRYLALLMPLYALMLAWSTQCAWALWPRLRLVIAAGFTGVLWMGAASIRDDLRLPREPLPFEAVAQAMAARGLKFAYADYWLAYATTFLANERVILEPLYSNYAPHYGARVAAATRIGYVDFAPGKLPIMNGEVTILKRLYTVTEEVEVAPLVVLRVLQAKDR